MNRNYMEGDYLHAEQQKTIKMGQDLLTKEEERFFNTSMCTS